VTDLGESWELSTENKIKKKNSYPMRTLGTLREIGFNEATVKITISVFLAFFMSKNNIHQKTKTILFTHVTATNLLPMQSSFTSGFMKESC